MPSAEGNFPGSDSWDGDIWFGQTGQPFYLTPQIGNWGQATIMHEIGHALGLKHGHSDYTGFDLTVGGYLDGPGPRFGTRALPASHDSWAYSIMTYRSDPGNNAGGDPSFQGDQFNQPQTFMQNDIAALQYMYGADFTWPEAHPTDTVYTFNTVTGRMSINGVGQETPTFDAVNNVGKIFRTIWDGGGVDTYDFDNYTTNQTIDLTPGGWSTMNGAQLADLRPLSATYVAAPGNIANALLSNGDLRSLIENANGGSGNDTVYGNEGNNTGHGNGGNDTVFGDDGDDVLYGEAGNDTLDGWSGNDDVYGGDANGSMDGFSGNDYLFGSTGLDTLKGESGNDYMSGGTGIDSMVAGAGIDTLNGGLGDDTYYVQTGDSVVEANGEGTDTVNAAISWSLAGSYAENLNLTGVANINGTGNGLANIIVGNAGTNPIVGDADHDVLDGGAGADTLTGNTGNDTYYVDDAGDSVIEANGEGTEDTIYSSVTYSLSGRYIESLLLTGSANINGTGNSLGQTLIGNSGNNTLTALGGNDYLDGGAGGADTLIGGTRDDTYVYGAGDTLTEAAGEGTDTVRSAITATLGAELEVLELTGAANINGTGNALDNKLYGNAGDNVLTGGAGNDSFYIQNVGDNVSEAVGGGNDSIFSSVTYSLAGKQVENLTLVDAAAINGTGNGLANVLTGNSAVNTLDGGSGNDRLDGGASADNLIGGTGGDTYVVDDAGDAITELAGGGADLVEAWTTYTLGAEVENLTLMGSFAFSGTGNGLNNVLTGNTNTNTLSGGLGNDTYYVQNTGDNVVELAGEGTDTIYSTVTYSLAGRYAEAIILTGSANVNATGNSLTNSLTGNDGINTLNGKGGADNLTGGLGSDLFLFETASGADTVTDFSAAQNDTVNINAYTAGVTNTSLVSQSGANVVINLGGGNIITVLSATQADVLAHIVW